MVSKAVSHPEGLRPETLTAIDAVKRAFKLIQDVEPGAITSKGERDLVTATDLAVEDIIRQALTDTLGWTVIGEERGGEAPADGSPYWLVDPICGTRNLASGIPLYCINLAFIEVGMVTVAVVADPSSGEVGFAERGCDAWSLKDGERRKLKASADSQTIVIEEVKAKDERRERAANYIKAALRADRWDFRSFGSTVASLYVAAGRISAYAAFQASAVHAAAGTLLASEAGAIVTDIEGRQWTVESDSLLVAANDQLHTDLLALAHANASQLG